MRPTDLPAKQANFFQGLKWDSGSTPVQSYVVDGLSQHTPKYSCVASTCSKAAGDSVVINLDLPMQARLNRKRKRDNVPASEGDGGYTMKRTKFDGSWAVEPRPLHEVSNSNDAYGPYVETSKDPVMVVLPATSNEHKRRREALSPVLVGKDVVNAKQKSSVDPVINYHYPPVIPAHTRQQDGH